MSNYDDPVTVGSISDFVLQVSDPNCFGNTLFCSTWVMRRRRYLEYIRMSYAFANLHAPHLVPLLFILRDKAGKYIQSTKNPVKWGTSPIENSWSYGHIYASMLVTLPLLPIFQNKEQIRTIARSIVITYDRYHATRFGLWLINCFPIASVPIAKFVCGIIGPTYLVGFRIAQYIQKFRSPDWIEQRYAIGNRSTDRL